MLRPVIESFRFRGRAVRYILPSNFIQPSDVPNSGKDAAAIAHALYQFKSNSTFWSIVSTFFSVSNRIKLQSDQEENL